MTIRYMTEYKIEGLQSDLKPTWKNESSADGYLPAGAKFYEIDSKMTYTFDGSGTWYKGPENIHCYADSRIAIVISGTSTAVWSGTAFTKSGEKLSQVVVETGNDVGAITRTMYIYSGTTATVYFTSTAFSNNITSVRTLGTSEGPYFDGTFGIRYLLSTTGSQSMPTDYYTLYWAR